MNISEFFSSFLFSLFTIRSSLNLIHVMMKMIIILTVDIISFFFLSLSLLSWWKKNKEEKRNSIILNSQNFQLSLSLSHGNQILMLVIQSFWQVYFYLCFIFMNLIYSSPFTSPFSELLTSVFRGSMMIHDGILITFSSWCWSTFLKMFLFRSISSSKKNQ